MYKRYYFTDIDECSIYGNGCPQLCNNVKGSFKCQCAPGFTDVKGQGHDCKPKGRYKNLICLYGKQPKSMRSCHPP